MVEPHIHIFSAPLSAFGPNTTADAKGGVEDVMIDFQTSLIFKPKSL